MVSIGAGNRFDRVLFVGDGLCRLGLAGYVLLVFGHGFRFVALRLMLQVQSLSRLLGFVLSVCVLMLFEIWLSAGFVGYF